MKQMPTQDELYNFYRYMEMFYHPDCDPVFEFKGLTMEDIAKATADYINSLTEDQELIGDSIDREHVAQILCADYGYSYPD